jgi:lycopene cyclase domain-containing protein
LRFAYLLVLGVCLLGTLPLELWLHARVYRRWRRAALAIVPVAAMFAGWDALAVRSGWWNFNHRYVIGAFVGNLPIEEVLFFVVIPVCAILTLEAVQHMRPHWRVGRGRG